MSSSFDFNQDGSLRYIAPIVLLGHLLAIFFLLNLNDEAPKKEAPKKMVVQTIALNPKPIQEKAPTLVREAAPEVIPEVTQEEPIAYSYSAPAETPTEAPKEAAPKETKAKKELPTKNIPKATENPIKSKEPDKFRKPLPEKKLPQKPPEKKTLRKADIKPKKAPQKDVPTPKEIQINELKKKLKPKAQPEETISSTPVVKNVQAKPNQKEIALNQKKNALMQAAKEKISKINIPSGTMGGVNATSELTMKTPTAITSLSIDALAIDTDKPLTVKEAAYKDELRARLRLLLKLPQYGDVKIKLTINRQGRVTDLKIISAASLANREYIEKNLIKMSLPPFGSNFPQEESFTFTITISNE